MTNSLKKKLLLAPLFMSAIIASNGVAASDKCNNSDRQHNRQAQYEKGNKHFSMGRGMHHKGMLERSFNTDEIRTLMSARLLMQGNENLKVGSITPADEGFTVDIVTQEGSLVKAVKLAPNAMPVELYEKMQRRQKEHDSKAS